MAELAVRVPADERVDDAAPPTILFISGSPRRRTSTDLISLIEQGARKAGANTQEFFLCDKHIDPCTGCGSCEKTGACVLANRTQGGRFVDDYLELIAMLENCDAVALAVPLFFAGPPAQFKALLDRMQPYWTRKYLLGETMPPKRPAQLFILGAGGGSDPHGYDPLVISTKSAIQVAGFTMEKINLYVGFKAFADAPVLPPEGQREGLSKGEINKLKNAVVAQEDFVQRAIHAGGAYARYLIKMREKSVLTAELAAIEAELEALKSGADVVVASNDGGLTSGDDAQDSDSEPDLPTVA
jgi:multimeric flavodoxin WrbA